LKGRRKRLLERQRRRWEDGIKMGLREIGWGCGVDSPGSGYGPLAGCCECGDEPSGSGATELVNTVSTVSGIFHIPDFRETEPLLFSCDWLTLQ
jgi:hypothetical protein